MGHDEDGNSHSAVPQSLLVMKGGNADRIKFIDIREPAGRNLGRLPDRIENDAVIPGSS
ncbi:hypothetical protein D3C85_1136660 [compost metagenome]